jgi:hypothetical protein
MPKRGQLLPCPEIARADFSFKFVRKAKILVFHKVSLLCHYFSFVFHILVVYTYTENIRRYWCFYNTNLIKFSTPDSWKNANIRTSQEQFRRDVC